MRKNKRERVLKINIERKVEGETGRKSEKERETERERKRKRETERVNKGVYSYKR